MLFIVYLLTINAYCVYVCIIHHTSYIPIPKTYIHTHMLAGYYTLQPVHYTRAKDRGKGEGGARLNVHCPTDNIIYILCIHNILF
jgi:hypothetical protein